MGCVAFCRLRDGTKRGPRICATLCFLKFAKILKKMQKIKLLKSYGMCRFLPPLGRHQKCCPNLRYLVFFEIRKNVEKDAKNKIIKIIWDVSFFAASGAAPKLLNFCFRSRSANLRWFLFS